MFLILEIRVVLSNMMRKNVFVNQHINFANCEKSDVKQTLPSAEFDSNNEHFGVICTRTSKDQDMYGTTKNYFGV